ncbi:MAG: C39 family peptidase [Anaerovoracaceae bacterium]
MRFLTLLFFAVVIISFFITGTRESREISRIELENAFCPESLIALAERNPETRSFVMHYSDYEGVPGDIDISKDVTPGQIPLFIQWDERWGYEKYGDDFLAITGCGPTCLSMVYTGLTGKLDLNPYEMARRAEGEGYYVRGSGSSWSLMDEFASETGLRVSSVIFDEDHILAALNQGHPVICSMGPGEFTTTGHFIVLTDVKNGDEIVVNDPNSIKNSRKTWKLKALMPQIKNLWAYSHQTPDSEEQ